MDGTFKTVPNIFLQLYTIHAPVGTKINNKILPLVYALMASKSEQCYEQLFEGLISICDDYGYELLPKCIINDFEKAAINAVSNIFPEFEQTGCFSHLGQNIWRKIQSSGLATHYGNDIENGSVSRSASLYPPSFWSVYYNNENNIPRTQNNVESWHKRWKILVGAERVGIYHLIIEMCKEQQNTLGQIELIISGNQRPKPKLTSIKRQLQIQNVIEDKNNRNTIDFLKVISYNLNF
ncbi:hypothetical protein QTP88_012211 [Uroleucon formosanum]